MVGLSRTKRDFANLKGSQNLNDTKTNHREREKRDRQRKAKIEADKGMETEI